MPIYEYQCRACDAGFETLVRSSDEERTVRCPNCGSAKIERKLSVFAAHAAAPQSPGALPRGGCGRCGDPAGPCGID